MALTPSVSELVGSHTTTSAEVPRVGRRPFAVVNVLATLAFLAMIVATAAMVFIREVVGVAVPWLDDAVRFLLVWSVYLGAAALSLRNDHIAIELLYAKMSEPLRRKVRMLIGTVGMVLSGYLAYLGWLMTERAYGIQQMSPSGYLPAWTGFAALPVGFALGTVGYLFYVNHVRSRRE